MMILIFDVNIQKLYGLWIHFAWQSIDLGWAKSLYKLCTSFTWGKCYVLGVGNYPNTLSESQHVKMLL